MRNYYNVYDVTNMDDLKKFNTAQIVLKARRIDFGVATFIRDDKLVELGILATTYGDTGNDGFLIALGFTTDDRTGRA